LYRLKDTEDVRDGAGRRILEHVVHTLALGLSSHQQPFLGDTTPTTQKHLDTTTEEPETTEGNAGSIAHPRDGIQQKPYPYRLGTRTHRGGN
jgi:hypothetical protein